MENLVLKPRQEAEAAVFWLHGLGADQHDLAPVAQQLSIGERARHILVQAPSRAVAINSGVVMPAWFDIHPGDMGLSGQMADAAGLAQSIERIGAMIQEQCRQGLAPDNIAVVGFSQGGAIALATALASADALGAVASLSGWLVRNPLPRFHASGDTIEPPQDFPESIEPKSRQPVLLHHGQHDPVVPAQSSAIAEARLRALGLDPTLEYFNCEHGILPEQIPLLDRFLGEALGLLPA